MHQVRLGARTGARCFGKQLKDILPYTEYEQVKLTLVDGDLEITSEFEGRLLGEARYIDEEREERPQEIIRIYQRKDGKFVSYMEDSDREDGAWMSKMCVTERLTIAAIKEGLTQASYKFGKLQIENVP